MLIPTNNSLQLSNFFQAAFFKFNSTVNLNAYNTRETKNVASI